jgi:hypothetical protein
MKIDFMVDLERGLLKLLSMGRERLRSRILHQRGMLKVWLQGLKVTGALACLLNCEGMP